MQWCGSCVGDDTSKVGALVLRIVAFQTAGHAGDFKEWTKQWSIHLRGLGGHIGAFTETPVNGADRHAQVVNSFLEQGVLAISHNTTTSRSTNATGTEEDNELGPRAAGVILALTIEYAG